MLETHVSGRKVDRRVLATDIDAELGLITCVWDLISQIARRSTPERRCARVYLIPVSGVGEAVGGVNEAVSGERIGGNGVEGTLHKDTIKDEMTLEAHEQTVKPLSQTCDHILRASVRSEKKVRVCAFGEVLSVQSPSSSWQLPLSGRATARKKKS